jgi:hypothetical protein
VSFYTHTINEPRGGSSPIIVTGSASVTGSGTITVPGVKQIIAVLDLYTVNNSSSAYYLVEQTAAPSGNSLSVEVLEGTIGGTAANPTVATSAVTVYYAVLAV